MKKVFWVFAFVLAFSLLGAGAAWGVPNSPAGEGFSVFVERDLDWYESAIIGVGCGISDNLTVGGFYAEEYGDFGLYANLALGPIHFNGEVFFYEYYTCGMAGALYVFDLGPLSLGVGGGFDFYDGWHGDFFVSIAAEAKAGPLAVYGAVNHFPDYDWNSCKIGVNVAF